MSGRNPSDALIVEALKIRCTSCGAKPGERCNDHASRTCLKRRAAAVVRTNDASPPKPEGLFTFTIAEALCPRCERPIGDSDVHDNLGDGESTVCMLDNDVELAAAGVDVAVREALEEAADMAEEYGRDDLAAEIRALAPDQRIDSPKADT